MTPPRVSDERLANSIKTSRVPAAATFILDCIKDLREARAEIVRLNATQEREVRQFNAGHDAAEKHEGPLPRNTFDPSPNDHTGPDGMFEPDEDTWRIGFAFGAYDALARERDALAERVRALRGECVQLVESKDFRRDNPTWAERLDKLLAAAPAATERRSHCVGGTSPGGTPQDCGWPDCGCDPHVDRVIDGLAECGRFVISDADRLALVEAGVRAGTRMLQHQVNDANIALSAARVLAEHDKRKEGK